MLAISTVAIFISSQLSFADSGKFNVADKIEINIDDTETVYSSTQSIDNQSDYTYCIDKINLECEAGVKLASNWYIKIDGYEVYNGEAGSEITLEQPVYIASKAKSVVEIASDMNIADAKKLSNKNLLSIKYGVCKLGKIQDMTIDDKSSPNDLDSNKLRFS